MRAMAVGCLLLLAGCQHEAERAQAPPPAVEEAPPAEPAAPSLDGWVGRWNGPEGTYLAIAKGAQGYTIEIANLDGPKSYAGVAAGDRLEFVRDGKTESIRATSGAETGMKWLQDKTDCLTIQPGEGFCRD
ncbi:MAG TPA: hypothetical protein VFG76_01435 [Candidatus Polarisedimenticolia bacterium]|nr:hypothetical protein [Candidatus Polarisedimenticolia bacterium]